jgi:protein O-GlcNAc transferase
MELTVQEALLKGIEAHKEGKLQDAERIYRAILEVEPNHPDANHNLGVLAVGVGKSEESLPFFKKALEANPSQPQFWVSCINALLQAGRVHEASKAITQAKVAGVGAEALEKLEVKVIELTPSLEGPPAGTSTSETKMSQDCEVLLREGLRLHQANQLEEAKTIYEEILAIEPDHFDALHLLGVIEHQTQNYELALELISRAIQINPNIAPSYSNRGLTLHELNQYEKAIASYDKAIGLKPDYAEAWYHRGNALLALKQYEKAITSFDKSTSFKPDYADAWSNRGNALQELQQYNLAIASYDQAISLNPDYAPAWSNRGIVLQELCRYHQALASYDKAISLKPGFTEAWYNRGNALQDLGRFSLAEASYREAIRLDPQYLVAHNNLLFCLNFSNSSQQSLAEAKRFGFKVSERAKDKFTEWDIPIRAEKLRIGFVSGDLNNHPVGFFVEGLLEKLDKNQLELFGFPTTSKSDDLTNRIKPSFAEWTPIYGMLDQEAATLIHQKSIHILIDLSGHSAHNRLAVFSYKPAPLQVSWLGYFATTGLPEMDYFLGDPIMTPESEQHHFTERLWSLPKTWLCLKPPTDSVSISDLPALTNGFVTFGCFGNYLKMNNEVILVWSKILKTMIHAKLHLKSKQYADPEVIKIVQEKFSAHGVVAERLICEGPSSRSAYFEAYNSIDIVLDTFPYPGGTTSVDALWMGVPVLTLKGDRFLSHLGESIATSAGQTDWIAEDHDDYVNKAVAFASNLPELAAVRKNLRDRVLRTPLFDTDLFAKDFGATLWSLWHEKSKSLQ